LPQTVGIGNFDHGNGLYITVWPSRNAAEGWDKYFPYSQIEMTKKASPRKKKSISYEAK
jgi:hypothetical protein